MFSVLDSYDSHRYHFLWYTMYDNDNDGIDVPCLTIAMMVQSTLVRILIAHTNLI